MRLRLVALCLAAGFCLSAQPAPEKAIRTAMNDFAKAVVARDQMTLNRVMADSLAYSHSNGKIDTKASFIGNVMAQTPTYEAFTLGDQNVRVFGKTATVRGKITVKDINEGQHRTLELSVLQVWVHVPAGWQLVERQATRLNP